MTVEGILLVDKPEGPTSADVVRAVKRLLRPAAIGHLGTLDPMATGLLPLCVDGGTKIAQFLSAERKAYRGRIRLGSATDTLDRTGRVVATAPVPALEQSRLEEVAASLTGPSLQRPPMYSAVKVGGRELYKLAREGVEIEREERPIVVHSLALERVDGDATAIDFEVDCSKGTYVRVIAEEVGRRLGTVACLDALRRTRFGDFRVEDARPLAEILGGGPLPLVAPRAALRPAREIHVDRGTAFGIAAGQRGAMARLDPPSPEDRLGAVIAPGERLLAVVEAAGPSWALRRVLLPEAAQLYRSGTDC